MGGTHGYGFLKQAWHLYVVTDEAMINTKRVKAQLIRRICLTEPSCTLLTHEPHLNVCVGGFQVHPTHPSIFDLSPSEKLQLVEDLWDDLAATPEAVPVHDWQKEELARRKANLMQNQASGLTWEEVKQRVRSRYGR